MSDASQKRTDEQYRLHELREGARRFAPLEPEPTFKESLIVPRLPALLTPDNWEGWLEKRKQIERDEKRAFNEKYNYTP